MDVPDNIYQAKRVFSGCQTMKSCHDLDSKDKRKHAYHDKDRANGGVQTLGGMAKNHIMVMITQYVTQNLVHPKLKRKLGIVG